MQRLNPDALALLLQLMLFTLMDVCLEMIIDWKSNPEITRSTQANSLAAAAAAAAATAGCVHMGVLFSHVSGRAVHTNRCLLGRGCTS